MAIHIAMAAIGSLALPEVTRLAREAASGQAVPHEVVGVFVGGRGSDYVEILITRHAPGTEPSLLVIGAFRNVAEAAFRRVITLRLRQHDDRP